MTSVQTACALGPAAAIRLTSCCRLEAPVSPRPSVTPSLTSTPTSPGRSATAPAWYSMPGSSAAGGPSAGSSRSPSHPATMPAGWPALAYVTRPATASTAITSAVR